MVYALHHPKKPKNCALVSTISPSIQYQKYPKIIHEKSLKNGSPPTSKLDISRVASLRRLEAIHQNGGAANYPCPVTPRYFFFNAKPLQLEMFNLNPKLQLLFQL